MSKYRSSQLAQKKKKQFKLKIVLILVISISFFFSLSALSKCDFLSIQKVEIQGNKIILKESIKEIIDKNLEDNYFWLFSKSNIFIYSKQTIKTEIIKSFPRIKEVDLDLDLPSLLNINITEREPYVLWCGNSSTTSCFFADDEGYIFANSDDIVNSDLFRYYTGSSTPIRQNIFSKGVFKEIDSFVKFIEGLDLKPYKFVRDKEKFEIYFGSQKSKIIFDQNQNIKEVMNNLQSVLNMDEFTDIEDIKKLEYLDLRFGNKIFYK